MDAKDSGDSTPSAEPAMGGGLRHWIWLVPLTVLWPALQLALFLLRFGDLPSAMFSESLVFAPMSAAAGAVLLYLVGRARSRAQRWTTIAGYCALSPFTLVGSLMGRLVFSPALGVLIFGLPPLVLGSLVGYRSRRS